MCLLIIKRDVILNKYGGDVMGFILGLVVGS